MMKMQIYYEGEIFPIERTPDILENPFIIESCKSMKKFHGLYATYADLNYGDRIAILGMSYYNSVYYGCLQCQVFAHVYNENGNVVLNQEILPNWTTKRPIHRPNCWIRKYEGICKDLAYRTNEEQLQMLKELGWKEDTMWGSAILCDCGLNEAQDKCI